VIPIFDLTPIEAGAEYDIPVATIIKLAKDRVIGRIVYGGKVIKITSADLEKWAERQKDETDIS